MIVALSNRLLSFLISNELVNENDSFDIDYYRYGLEILISSIFNILIIMLLSAFTNDLLCGLIFLFVFIPTRQYTGGFHADTYFRCNLIFGLSYFLTYCLYCCTSQYISLATCCVILILEIIFIICYCPIANNNKPISDRTQKKRFKVLSAMAFGGYGILGSGLIFMGTRFGYMFLYTLHLIVVLGILGILKERRKNNEKAE